MECFKIKSFKNQKFILVISLLLLITFLSIIFVYNYKFKNISSKSNTFDYVIKDINSINNSIKECPTEFTLNNETIITTLKNNIDNLEKIKNDLRAVIIIDDYSRESLSKILSSIESAQNLYNCCISSLEYKNMSATSEYINKINEQQFNLLKSYSDLNYLGIKIDFNEQYLMFFEKLISHLSNLDNIAKKNNINASKNQLFMKNFETAIIDFSELVEDLEPAISKVREDSRSFDSILSDISNKEIKYLSIKSNINSISIPDGYLSYYNSLMDTFNLYSNYLKTLKIAIIFEKSSTNYSTNKENIDKNYKNAFSKLNDVIDSLNSLKKSLENF